MEVVRPLDGDAVTLRLVGRGAPRVGTSPAMR